MDIYQFEKRFKKKKEEAKKFYEEQEERKKSGKFWWVGPSSPDGEWVNHEEFEKRSQEEIEKRRGGN